VYFLVIALELEGHVACHGAGIGKAEITVESGLVNTRIH
jgi:hypothetical protein